jgi:hypothetical protein
MRDDVNLAMGLIIQQVNRYDIGLRGSFLEAYVNAFDTLYEREYNTGRKSQVDIARNLFYYLNIYKLLNDWHQKAYGYSYTEIDNAILEYFNNMGGKGRSQGIINAEEDAFTEFKRAQNEKKYSQQIFFDRIAQEIQRVASAAAAHEERYGVAEVAAAEVAAAVVPRRYGHGVARLYDQGRRVKLQNEALARRLQEEEDAALARQFEANNRGAAAVVRPRGQFQQAALIQRRRQEEERRRQEEAGRIAAMALQEEQNAALARQLAQNNEDAVAAVVRPRGQFQQAAMVLPPQPRGIARFDIGPRGMVAAPRRNVPQVRPQVNPQNEVLARRLQEEANAEEARQQPYKNNLMQKGV